MNDVMVNRKPRGITFTKDRFEIHMYAITQHFVCLFKINQYFTQQGCNKLIRSDSKDIYFMLNKDLYFK